MEALDAKGPAAAEGWLWKRGEGNFSNIVMNLTWRKRWFRLYNKVGQLHYYARSNDLKPLGFIDLSKSVQICAREDNFGYPHTGENWGFEITSEDRIWCLMAPSKAEMMLWLDRLKRYGNKGVKSQLTPQEKKQVTSLYKKPLKV